MRVVQMLSHFHHGSSCIVYRLQEACPMHTNCRRRAFIKPRPSRAAHRCIHVCASGAAHQHGHPVGSHELLVCFSIWPAPLSPPHRTTPNHTSPHPTPTLGAAACLALAAALGPAAAMQRTRGPTSIVAEQSGRAWTCLVDEVCNRVGRGVVLGGVGWGGRGRAWVTGSIGPLKG